MPITPKAIRHFEHAAKEGDRKDSQTVSFSQFVSLVSNRLTFAQNGKSSPYPRHSRATKRRAPDTRNTMRHFEQAVKKEDRKDSQTVSLVSNRLTSTDKRNCHPTIVGERCGECDSPKIPPPSHRFFPLCVLCALCGESSPPVVGESLPRTPLRELRRGQLTPSPVVGEGWGEGDTPMQLAIIPHALRNTFYFL